MKRVCVAALSLLLLTGASDTDWKWFGGSTVNGDTQNVLYDARGVKRLPDGHIQVWTKTISSKDLERAHMSDAVRDQAVNRMRNGYQPEAFPNPTNNQLIDLLLLEAFANEGVLTSKIVMLWELDCKGDMSRTLSIHVRDGNELRTSDRPSEWNHNAPETNAARLNKALCAK